MTNIILSSTKASSVLCSRATTRQGAAYITCTSLLIKSGEIFPWIFLSIDCVITVFPRKKSHNNFIFIKYLQGGKNFYYPSPPPPSSHPHSGQTPQDNCLCPRRCLWLQPWNNTVSNKLLQYDDQCVILHYLNSLCFWQNLLVYRVFCSCSLKTRNGNFLY